MSEIFYQPKPEEIKACEGNWLFTDGGCVGPNPSPIAGTWAWVRVQDGVEVARGSGVLTGERIGCSVSSNISELYAMVNAIKALPENWRGTICSDSFVTLARRFENSKMNGVPLELIPFARTMFRRVRESCRWVLVDGHPTKSQLESGYGKRDHVVSSWNVWCDKECTRLAKEFKTQAGCGDHG